MRWCRHYGAFIPHEGAGSGQLQRLGGRPQARAGTQNGRSADARAAETCGRVGVCIHYFQFCTVGDVGQQPVQTTACLLTT
jgi:hypothetical protein